MKYVTHILLAILVLAMVVTWILNQAAYSCALKALRDSRPGHLRGSDYEFVTKGVLAGMSYDDVKEIMRGSKYGKLMLNEVDSAQPYFALFRYNYSGLPFAPFSDWEKVYISEEFTLFFDRERRATRMQYRVFDRGAQEIDVDLSKRSLSEPIKLR